jgi:hypothetical protein
MRRWRPTSSASWIVTVDGDGDGDGDDHGQGCYTFPVAKDRAAPFSKKHRRYWVPILGGMIVIGGLNLLLGYCAWPGEEAVYRTPEAIVPVLPALHVDAGPAPDATPPPPPDASPR